MENPTSEGDTTDKINLTELRESTDHPDWDINPATVLALIDVVEAAHAYATADQRYPDTGTALTLHQALARFQP